MAKDVSEWLGRLGLETYAEAFARNDVDLRSLPHLDQDDLKELGVSLGHRKVILAAIADWQDGAAAGPATPIAEPATRSRKEAERRHLTVMFVDLVDNMEKIGDHLTNIAQGVIGGLQWNGKHQADPPATPAE